MTASLRSVGRCPPPLPRPPLLRSHPDDEPSHQFVRCGHSRNHVFCMFYFCAASYGVNKDSDCVLFPLLACRPRSALDRGVSISMSPSRQLPTLFHSVMRCFTGHFVNCLDILKPLNLVLTQVKFVLLV